MERGRIALISALAVLCVPIVFLTSRVIEVSKNGMRVPGKAQELDQECIAGTSSA